MEELLEAMYPKAMANAAGIPKIVGRRATFVTRVFLVGFSLPVEGLRSRAMRTPSRVKRIVESKSSNWMEAVPKVCGEASRTSAWLRAKVNMRDTNRRRTSEDAEASDASRTFTAGAPLCDDVADSIAVEL